MKSVQASGRPLLLLALVTVLVALTLPTLPLSAQEAPSASPYTLDWWTVDGGGQTGPAGAGYTLEGTIGQPDAALWEGGTYTLAGGFWAGGGAAAPQRYQVYLPLVVR